MVRFSLGVIRRDKTNLDAVTEDMQGVGVTEKGWGEMKAHDLLW